MLEAIDADSSAVRLYVALHRALNSERQRSTRPSRVRAFKSLETRCEAAKRRALAVIVRRNAAPPRVTVRVPDEARYCPRGHGRLNREGDDYYCLPCGYREPVGQFFTEESLYEAILSGSMV